MHSILIAAAHRLMERAQKAGCLHIDGHVPSREERALCAEIRDFTRELKGVIEDAAPEHLYRLTTYYDMLYRVGFHEAPSQKFRDDMMRRFFESWEAGNAAISEAEIYAMIAPKVRANAAAVEPRYYSAYYRLKTAWTRTESSRHIPQRIACGKLQPPDAAYRRQSQRMLSRRQKGGRRAQTALDTRQPCCRPHAPRPRHPRILPPLPRESHLPWPHPSRTFASVTWFEKNKFLYLHVLNNTLRYLHHDWNKS